MGNAWRLPWREAKIDSVDGNDPTKGGQSAAESHGQPGAASMGKDMNSNTFDNGSDCKVKNEGESEGSA